MKNRITKAVGGKVLTIILTVAVCLMLNAGSTSVNAEKVQSPGLIIKGNEAAVPVTEFKPLQDEKILVGYVHGIMTIVIDGQTIGVGTIVIDSGKSDIDDMYATCLIPKLRTQSIFEMLFIAERKVMAIGVEVPKPEELSYYSGPTFEVFRASNIAYE